MNDVGTAPARAEKAAFERASLALGLMLLALAGWIDGVGFVRWGELYVSFMSGNTAQFGSAPTVADWDGFGKAARALAMFVVGVVGGELIATPVGRWRGPVVVTGTAALLWLAAACAIRGWGDDATAAAAGLAMGLQTAAVHKANGVSISLTFVTGTLVKLGRGIAAALRGEGSWRELLPLVGFWLALAVGSAAGGSTARAGVDVAMVVAAGAASALAVYAGAVARLRDR